MGYSIWNPYTSSGKFLESVQPNECALSNTPTSCVMFKSGLYQREKIFFLSVKLAYLLEIHTPIVQNVSWIFQRGCVISPINIKIFEIVLAIPKTSTYDTIEVAMKSRKAVSPWFSYKDSEKANMFQEQ